MASTKRPATKSKSKSAAAATATKKKRGPGRPKGSGMVNRPPKLSASQRTAAKAAAAGEKPPISPVTGLPVREKIHLPIKGYGRLNGFEVLENLFGKTLPQLKQILTYEEAHQARRMVIDRINDMLRRATQK